MATIVREAPAVKCSNRFSVFNTGIDLNSLCTGLHDISCNKPAMILCNNHSADDSSVLHNDIYDQHDLCNNPTADDSYILLNDVNVQNDLGNNPIADGSSILQTEVTDTTADYSSILHNEGNGQ